MKATIDEPTGSREKTRQLGEDRTLLLTRQLLVTLIGVFTEFLTTDGDDPDQARRARFALRALEILSGAFADWIVEPTHEDLDMPEDADPDDEVLGEFEDLPHPASKREEALAWAIIEWRRAQTLLTALELVLVELLCRDRSPSYELMAAIHAAASQLVDAEEYREPTPAGSEAVLAAQWLVRRAMELARRCEPAASLQRLVSAVINPSLDGLGGASLLTIALSKSDRKMLLSEIRRMINTPDVKRGAGVPVLEGLLCVLAEKDLEVLLGEGQ